MESMTPLFWVFALLLALDNFAQVMANRHRAGRDAPDKSAELRAGGWSAVAKAMRRWLLADLMGSAGWLFTVEPFLAPGSALGDAVAVFGGGLLLFCAVLFLSGASSLATAVARFRDAKRLAAEIPP